MTLPAKVIDELRGATPSPNPWKDKVVLLTGVAGTVGREIARQVIAREPRAVVGVDNNESALFFVENDFADCEQMSFALADVCDVNQLIGLMEGVDIVLHVAALKHVALCERAPRVAIRTNILGTQNVIQAALATDVKRVLFTSSDKAVNPTNVMGTSKLMAERLITAANAQSRGNTIFASTRFGNVLGSRGSVIPLFKQQIRVGGPVTLTDPHMSRFIMTLSEAVSLVMEAVFLAKGGEVFVTKMPVCRIVDLALILIEELALRYGYATDDVSTRLIGAKPGEKLYEELLNDEEVRRTVELERYFVVLPALRSTCRSVEYIYPTMQDSQFERPYNSSTAPPMDREQLRHYLHMNGFFDDD